MLRSSIVEREARKRRGLGEAESERTVGHTPACPYRHAQVMDDVAKHAWSILKRTHAVGAQSCRPIARAQ